MNDPRNGKSAEEISAELALNFRLRRCMVCSVGSGGGLLLPRGWSFTTINETGALAAFFCAACAVRLGLPEARNYWKDRN